MLLVVGLLGTGCDDAPSSVASEAEPTTPLTVETQSDDALTGTFTQHDVTVAFDSRIDGEQIEATIDVDGAPIDVSMDAGVRSFAIDGHGFVPSATERQVLAALAPALRTVVADDAAPLHQSMLVRMSDFLSQAPKGMAIDAYTHESSPDKAIQCLTLGTTVLADYWAYGTHRQRVITVGANFGVQPDGDSYACMGQCGAACENTAGGWCKDCMDHDYCSFEQNAGYSAADPACAAEWWEASDDYAFGGYCTG